MAKSDGRIKTRYPGIVYRQDSKRRHNGKPDKIFEAQFKVKGISKRRIIGRASDGWTAQTASDEIPQLKREALLEIEPRQDKTPTFDEAFERYFEKCNFKHIDRERSRYENHIKKYFEGKKLNEVRAIDINKYKVELDRKGLRPSTIKKALALIRSMYFFAMSEGEYEGLNPAAKSGGAILPKVDNESERWLQPDEARKLLEELKRRSHEVYAMALTSLLTGLRSTEIFSLRKKDISMHDSIIYVQGKGSNDNPKKNQSIGGIPETVMYILRFYASMCSHDEHYLFPMRGSGGTKKKKEIPDTFKRAVDYLQLHDSSFSDNNKGRCWFHTLRHTYTTWLSLSNQITTREELKDYTRHQSDESLKIYDHNITVHRPKMSYLEVALESDQPFNQN